MSNCTLLTASDICMVAIGVFYFQWKAVLSSICVPQILFSRLSYLAGPLLEAQCGIDTRHVSHWSGDCRVGSQSRLSGGFAWENVHMRKWITQT